MASEAAMKVAEKVCDIVGWEYPSHGQRRIADALEPLLAAKDSEIANLETEVLEEIGNRDHLGDQITEIYAALGGEGEWCARIPPQEPPNSGDLGEDARFLAAQAMERQAASFMNSAIGLSAEQQRADALAAQVAALQQQVSDAESRANERGRMIEDLRRILRMESAAQ